MSTKHRAPRQTPNKARVVVKRHNGKPSVGAAAADFELFHDNGVIAKPNADAHSPGFVIPGRSIRSSRLPAKPTYAGPTAKLKP